MDRVSQLIRNWEQAHSSDEISQVVDALAQIGEPVVEPLLQYARDHPTSSPRHRTVMRVLAKIGYPANRSGLSFMAGIASNQNSSAWDIAVEALKEIGEPAIGEIRETLLFCYRDLDDYRFEIQSLCILLGQMGSPVIDPLLPELLHILEIGTDENRVDEYALGPLRKIGSPKADVAIPLLRDKILSKRVEHVRKAAIEALLDFDLSVVCPLVPILRDCLSSESHLVRDSASKVLKALE